MPLLILFIFLIYLFWIYFASPFIPGTATVAGSVDISTMSKLRKSDMPWLWTSLKV